MQVFRETSGPHTIYKLKGAELDDALGEAVVSEVHDEFRLHAISVKPEFRGKGYGRLIMNAVLKEAQTKRVTLCTGLGNITFFKRFGFEIINVKESLVFMEKIPVIA